MKVTPASDAEADRQDAITVAMYSIYNGERCIDYFLVDLIGMRDTPPGDCYHKWGFQEAEGEMHPSAVEYFRRVLPGLPELPDRRSWGAYRAERII